MIRILTILLVVALGCGDDDVDPLDAGGGDDAAPPSDLGDGRDERTLSFQVDDTEEAPIEGVFVTVDTSAGRFEDQTDASGAATVTVRVADDDRMVIQLAKEGYRIDALDVPAADVPDTIERVLAELGVGLGDRSRVSFTLTGLPEGAHACTAFDGFSFCHPTDDDTPQINVPLAFLGDDAGVFILDGSGGLHDYETVALTESGANFTAAMTIDGTPELTVRASRDLRFLVPPDEPSRLADSELPEGWGWWALQSDVATSRSLNVCGRATRDGNAILARCHFFDVTVETEERVVIWADTGLMSRSGFTTRLFASGGIPAETRLLGTAQPSGGPSATGTFSWTVAQVPDGTTGELWYAAGFQNASGVTQRLLLTQGASDITLPALPDGYDQDVSYPFPGAGGNLVIQSLVWEEPPLFAETTPPEMVSTSEPHPITF